MELPLSLFTARQLDIQITFTFYLTSADPQAVLPEMSIWSDHFLFLQFAYLIFTSLSLSISPPLILVPSSPKYQYHLTTFTFYSSPT